MMRLAALVVLLATVVATPCLGLDSPWISDVFFYWYSWDYEQEQGGWIGGVYNTPLSGYYDSSSYKDNLASLHQASEWGLTHHFMDYWGPGWQASEGGPREALLMNASEELRDRGYDIWMSVYQDGTDFDMAEFSKNLDPGRDAEFYLSRYAKSPLYPKVDGKPFALIYGRNGRPQNTATEEGFQTWLKDKYGDIEALNQRWRQQYDGFDDVKLDLSAKGHHRAESIKYQYKVWGDEIAATNAKARDQFSLPGCIFSWDVAYGPFAGWGYADQTRVFTGPHSYGGIFGVPHQSDVERFIQAAVAKRYDTVFLDSFKNFYHDWEIRIPGICYPPDFCAFDRFWVQSLSHYSEGLLHLSWNEWWEGSNLEPCFEYGKTYCEKNLLYATIMKQCFDSIRQWNEGAQVAVLLNDWHWLAGGRHPDDIYTCIQALRRSGVKFDLVPDDFVTGDELSKFDVVLAPSGGVGFGYNAKDEPIEGVLMDWLDGGDGRALLIDDYEGLPQRLGIQLPPMAGEAAPTPRGKDMNVYIDFGAEGDDEFLIDGASHREDWSALSPDKYGATDRKYTVRWTPAVGLSTVLMVPLSPGRDHVLRVNGNAIWPSQVTVLIDGEAAVGFDVKAGTRTYEVRIPADVVGDLAFGELQLKYDRANIPKEKAPEQYESEGRACNLAIDWIQLATADQAFSMKQNYEMPQSRVRFSPDAPEAVKDKVFTIPYARHRQTSGVGTVLSTYLPGGAARDMALQVGDARVLYVNGLFSGIEEAAYLDSLVCEWAGAERPALYNHVARNSVTLTSLQAGDTEIVLAYNYDAPQEREFFVGPKQMAGGPPVVELQMLSRDGEMFPSKPRRAVYLGGLLLPSTKCKYYSVYQVTRGRVHLDTPALEISPGQQLKVPVTLEGFRAGGPRRTYEGRVTMVSHIPSLTSDSAPFTVEAGRKTSVPLTISARDDIDWGQKTVIFDIEIAGRHSYYWRPVLVKRLPDLQVTSKVIDAGMRQATITSVPFPWAQDATADDVQLTLRGTQVEIGDIAPGERAQVVALDCPQAQDEPAFEQMAAALEYTVGGVKHEKPVTVGFATYPEVYARAPGAVAPLIVVNHHDEYLENVLVSYPLDADLLGGKPAYVREQAGNVVPSQVVGGERLYWIAMLPPKSSTLYYLCAGQANQPATDLVVTEDEGGVQVGNSRFSLGWSGGSGGTLTRLVSRATGKDYAAGSFGVGYGTWGKYDVDSPVTNTPDFLSQEDKVWQRNSKQKAEVKVGLRGPVVASVDVEVALPDGVKSSQRYMIAAYQPDFTVGSEVSAPQSDELVALDVRLKRQALTKIFPNFTGIAEGFTKDSPSAGWREAPYIPAYATMMTPNQYAESISVLPWSPRQMKGISKFRQGFWPEDRSQSGSVDYAQIELVAQDTSSAGAGARIVLHSGHQKVARIYRETHVDEPPTVITPAVFRWEGRVGRADAEAPAGWWSPYWHYAIPVTAGPIQSAEANPQVTFRPQFETLLAGCGALDPASIRAVAHTPVGVTELPVLHDTERDEVTVTLTDSAWPAPAPQTRELRLYVDTLSMGKKCSGPRPATPLANRVLNGSFEKQGRYWSLGGGRLHVNAARTGSTGLQLQWRANQGPVVASNSTMRLEPNSKYRVTFWAKSTDPRAAVRTNLYINGEMDFPQIGIPIAANGQWARYTTVLETGAFPLNLNPALRFWVLGDEQIVHLDDVEMQAMGDTPRAVVPVQLGKLIVR